MSGGGRCPARTHASSSSPKFEDTGIEFRLPSAAMKGRGVEFRRRFEGAKRGQTKIEKRARADKDPSSASSTAASAFVGTDTSQAPSPPHTALAMASQCPDSPPPGRFHATGAASEPAPGRTGVVWSTSPTQPAPAYTALFRAPAIQGWDEASSQRRGVPRPGLSSSRSRDRGDLVPGRTRSPVLRAVGARAAAAAIWRRLVPYSLEPI